MNKMTDKPSYLNVLKKYWYFVLLTIILIASTIFFIFRSQQPQVDLTVENPIDQTTVKDEIIEEQTVAQETGQDPIPVPQLQLSEIREHNTLADCWLVFDTEVYDISIVINDNKTYQYGGSSDISPACGQTDSTAKDIFKADNQDKPPQQYFIGLHHQNL